MRGRARRSAPDPPRWWSDNSSCRANSNSCDYLEVVGLRPRQLLESDARQGAAAPGILDAGPGECGIEIVAAVEENRAGLERVAERFGARGVCRENRGREAEFAVVNQPQRFSVRRNLHDANRGPERLFAHDRHRMVDIDQYLRREVGCSGGGGREQRLVDQRAGATGDGLPYLGADGIGGGGTHDGSERRFRIEG